MTAVVAVVATAACPNPNPNLTPAVTLAVCRTAWRGAKLQSSDEALIIEGEGFPTAEGKEPKLVFGFGGPGEESFTCRTVSEREVEVNLVAGHKWSTVAGPLSLLEASFGDDESLTVCFTMFPLVRSSVVFRVLGLECFVL